MFVTTFERFTICYTVPMPTEEQHQEMMRLLRENTAISKENNELLHKLYRHNVIGFIARMIWYAILIGVPIAAYYYILAPYFNAFGANYDTFRKGMAEIPGLKGLENLLPVIHR